MRPFILFAIACLCSCPATAQTRNQGSDNKAAAKQAQWPLQLEMRVPFEPTAFPSGGHVYLMYELHLTNFMPMPISLSRIEVLDADVETSKPIANFETAQLETMLQPLGGKTFSDPKDRLVIGDGQSAIVFMEVAFERGSHIPDRLLHRVTTSYAPEEGAVISTRHTELHVLGPPIEGPDWLADDGPSNDPDNHHRRTVVILDGKSVDSERYAIDWEEVKNGATFSGDLGDARSYYAYGKPPSLRVKAGDRVRRGQVLARVGASGDAREPHLHFEVTTSPKLLAGEGVPYLIDQYSTKSTDTGPAELHKHELPLDHGIVIFGEDRRK